DDAATAHRQGHGLARLDGELQPAQRFADGARHVVEHGARERLLDAAHAGKAGRSGNAHRDPPATESIRPRAWVSKAPRKLIVSVRDKARSVPVFPLSGPPGILVWHRTRPPPRREEGRPPGGGQMPWTAPETSPVVR